MLNTDLPAENNVHHRKARVTASASALSLSGDDIGLIEDSRRWRTQSGTVSTVDIAVLSAGFCVVYTSVGPSDGGVSNVVTREAINFLEKA